MTKAGYFRFEKLEVWKDARQLVSLVYRITANFPSKERFGLVDQIRRAAVSIGLISLKGPQKARMRILEDSLKWLKVRSMKLSQDFILLWIKNL